jgi:hypothetical protein
VGSENDETDEKEEEEAGTTGDPKTACDNSISSRAPCFHGCRYLLLGFVYDILCLQQSKDEENY